MADVFADPFSDAPRLVYGDWLQERSDPRGEFIALQFQADKPAAALKQEKALLKAHGKKWLGALAGVLGAQFEYHRGFVAKAMVKFRHQLDAQKYGSLAEWATLEELDYSYPNPIPKGQEPW